MKTILLVDDDKLNLNLALRILSKEYKVMPAPSGKVALDIVSKKEMDLILLDVLMPEMDGFETLKEMKNIKGDALAPVVFLTADETEETKQKGIELGAKGFLKKPLETAKLLQAVSDALSE